MIRKVLALLIIAGACNAYPHEVESNSEKDLIDPERGPLNPETTFTPDGLPKLEDSFKPDDSVDQERRPYPVENELVPSPTDIPGLQEGPKPDEADLKTDATFWPYYRSWYPSYRSYYPSYRSYYPSYRVYYPSYRTYWRYPSYRYYRPRYYW